ncbi:hypothetical protein FPOAC1_010171 [Fusarium poae]|uniref:hypothetical protein n=1 Tax=Fusarium poae TaxID=36050 RepID=UPI001CE8787F|nr:hypothetical protein FPOAC1_010171 [Fusarium poae]KAG8665376.1 hypothetical protein FPOAC1_010171 [Fusarium poae]
MVKDNGAKVHDGEDSGFRPCMKVTLQVITQSERGYKYLRDVRYVNRRRFQRTGFEALWLQWLYVTLLDPMNLLTG